MEEQVKLMTVAGRSWRILQPVIKDLETGYFNVFPHYDIKGFLHGLSGMGDLSRKKRLGLDLATGKKPENIINSKRTVI